MAYLNKRPSCFYDVQCGLNGRLCATSIDGDVNGIHPASFLKTELFHQRVSTTLGIFHLALVGVGGGREEDVSGRIIFRELEPRGYDVNPDHSDCAEGLCDRHAEEAHRAGPPDGDGLGGAEVGEVGHCMNGDGKGLDLHSELAGGRQTEELKREPLRRPLKSCYQGRGARPPQEGGNNGPKFHRRGVRRRILHRELRNEQCSRRGGRTDVPTKLRIHAQRRRRWVAVTTHFISATFAFVTGTADSTRLESNPVPWFQVGHLYANFVRSVRRHSQRGPE